jgi:uncharacterized membrane protein YesL
MANVDYEQKLNSKPYRFFDQVYRLLVLNVLTIILGSTVIGLFPAFVATTATLKQGNQMNVFKQFFKNFLHYFKKSFFVGLILLILYLVVLYAFYFYATSVVENPADFDWTLLFVNAGFIVCGVAVIVITILSVHLPLLVVTFESFTVGEIYKTSLYVTFRYFLTTLILFVLQVLIIGTFIFCMFDPRVLAIWLLVGISLPVFLQVKVTAAIYYKFSQIDFEKIMHQLDEEEEDDE